MTQAKQNLNGQLAFVQHHLPPLDAGEYRLTVSQDVSASTGTAFSSTHAFGVYGERFALKPQQVVKVFPPAGSQGQYQTTLPHLVLARKTLPWERTPNTGSVKLGIPHDSADSPSMADVPSWLALLVFDPDDFSNANAWPFQARNATVSDLFKPSDLGGEKIFTYFTPAVTSHPAVTLSDLLEVGESATEACQIIDVPLALFNRIAPTLSDLNWLAHSRHVTPGDQDDSVIIANRFPAIGQRSIVHLVSLEDMGAYLPDSAGGNKIPAGYGYVRLVSLSSWEFVTIDEKRSLTWYLDNLNGQQATPDDGFLRWPGTDGVTDTSAKRALLRGYVAMNHHTREGDQAVSWYRGPYVPYAPTYDVSQSSPPLLPSRSADRITAYDESTGMFDVSYAAAWQVGRMLALSNRAFTLQLYHWKMDLVRQAILGAAGSSADYSQLISDVLAGFEQQPGSDLSAAKSAISGLFSETPRLPGSVTEWLAWKWWLRGVPFNYLLPDSGMLPLESIRFFVIDQNWLSCLLDGALSVARPTLTSWALDVVFEASFFNQIRQQALSLISLDASTDLSTVSGFILNSAAVEDYWPGFLIDAFTSGADSPAAGTQVSQLRLERFSPTILIGFYNQLIQAVNIHEPPAGLHFGLDPVDDLDDTRGLSPTPEYKRDLRFISGSYLQSDGTSATLGDLMLADATTTGHTGDEVAVATFAQTRASDSRVVNASALASALEQALRGNGTTNVHGFTGKGLTASGRFTSAEFGLEMVESIETVALRLNQAAS